LHSEYNEIAGIIIAIIFLRCHFAKGIIKDNKKNKNAVL